MPCLVGCLALSFPRLAVFLVWLLGGNYLARAYEHWIWPLLGFFFLPLTTLAFAYSFNSLGHHSMPPLGWLLTGIALLVDVGLIGSGRTQWDRYQGRRQI
ncbi:MAG TPA: hypothetical protein VGJ84_05940 [Polyangiaceae bacterium]|jgi:hypothetical protein